MIAPYLEKSLKRRHTLKNKHHFFLLVLLAFAAFVFAMAFIGCAFIPVFHNTAENELKLLSESLADSRLDDLFRNYPTLRLVKSTDIGNGNMRHEFSYVTVEKEDTSQRHRAHANYFLVERHTTYSINIFVDASGVIYEVLTPVKTDTKTISTNKSLKSR